MQFDQRFEHLQTVLHEGDFQFFGVQAAAHGFKRVAGLPVGCESGPTITAALSELPAHQLRLIGKHRRLQTFHFFDGGFGFLGCQLQLANRERNACEQKMSQGSPARHDGLIEESRGSCRKPARFKIASLVEEQQTLV